MVFLKQADCYFWFHQVQMMQKVTHRCANIGSLLAYAVSENPRVAKVMLLDL